MLSHEITFIAGRDKSRRRSGRGRGSGRGKTSGRGHKGSGSRAGATKNSLFEGGQMPLFRRLPKRGFNNYNFATRYSIVNVSQLERFDNGQDIGLVQLSEAGLIPGVKSKVKVLGDGDITKNLKVKAHKFSKAAKQKIEASDGTVQVI